MYLQAFPIYGFMVGVNYWNTSMREDAIEDEPEEHLFQVMIGLIGISFHFWKS